MKLLNQFIGTLRHWLMSAVGCDHLWRLAPGAVRSMERSDAEALNDTDRLTGQCCYCGESSTRTKAEWSKLYQTEVYPHAKTN